MQALIKEEKGKLSATKGDVSTIKNNLEHFYQTYSDVLAKANPVVDHKL
jgi:hypothetical protein